MKLLQLDDFKTWLKTGELPAPKKAVATASLASGKSNPKKRSASTSGGTKLVYEESSNEEESPPAKAPAVAATKPDDFFGAKRRKVAETSSTALDAVVSTSSASKTAPKPAAAPAGSLKPISFSHTGTSWSRNGMLFVNSAPNYPGSPLVAAFDMDCTLIEPKSGRTMPANRADWRWWHPTVPDKLRELHERGYKIVVFTNQGYKDDSKHTEMMNKFGDIIGQLKLPMQIFMAGAKDKWRKPNTAMWEHFESKHNAGVKVDYDNSFYCGDAGGRVAGWKSGVKKDFSCGDRKFALNSGLPFKLPEELFLGQDFVADAKFIWDGIDPSKVLQEAEARADVCKQVIQKALAARKSPEMIIMIGCPASGKSSFSNRYLVPLGYIRVNRDTLGDQKKCVAAARQAFQQGKSVVVDNTNPGVEARSAYIQLAKDFGAQVRAFVLTTPRDLASHLNLMREKATGGDTKRIPDIAYNIYFKNFAAPTLAEGISAIVQLDWLPEFASAQERKLFLQYT